MIKEEYEDLVTATNDLANVVGYGNNLINMMTELLEIYKDIIKEEDKTEYVKCLEDDITGIRYRHAMMAENAINRACDIVAKYKE